LKNHHSHIELNISIDDKNEIKTAILQTLSPSELEHLVQRTLHEAGITQPVSLTLLLTDDASIQQLNKQYRQQDKPTDVLSFPLLDEPLVNAPPDQLWTASEADHEHEHKALEHLPAARDKSKLPAFVTPSELPAQLGDIVISWPTVVRQAIQAGHSPAFELLYLLAHGVLHLVGYDDQTEVGYSAMVHLQTSVLQAMGWKVQPT
jgi:probable rRNA maturation factor